MLLSVIIPVYKAEHTLDRCVKSVLMQDILNMEVLLVDDGSPDRCPQMCDEWAQRDSRVMVIHKKNGGPGSARNAALDVASGEYITFVDSDDYIEPYTYPPLLERMQHEELDMMEYSLEQQCSTRSAYKLSENVFYDYRDYWQTTMVWRHGYLCNKIFRGNVIGTDRLPDRMICEDLLFLPALLKKCSKIATTTHGTYVYAASPNGLSKAINIRSVYGVLYAEIRTSWMTRTMPWSKNGINVYYYMCCRIYDIIRLCIGIKL